MNQHTALTETFDVKGGHLVEKIKDLLHDGNVRRLIIKDSDHKTVMEVPVTVGIVGFIVAPSMAAIAAVAALAADYSVEVERDALDTTEAATSAAEKGAGHE